MLKTFPRRLVNAYTTRPYRALQRRFGKSSKVRDAGIFVSTLARKLAAAGGQLIEFGTRNTCLSQFNYVDGTLTKKRLSQRYHEFSDGTRVGRDLYCAFLARFVHNDRLNASQVRAAWPDVEALLRAASDGLEPASGRGFALPHVTSPGFSQASAGGGFTLHPSARHVSARMTPSLLRPLPIAAFSHGFQ
jgi:hypothetical protein